MASNTLFDINYKLSHWQMELMLTLRLQRHYKDYIKIYLQHIVVIV